MANYVKQSIVIEPGRIRKQYFQDIWQYRELFFFLSWRDILVRYKQTVIGIAWSVIRPLLTMIIFTIVFSKLAKLPSQGVPYPILIYCAMLPWQFFANSFTQASNSLILNAPMLRKVYFPRLIVPASSIIVCLIDFCISFLILICLMLWYQFVPTWKIIFIPVFFLISIILTLGAGCYIAALNVKYRDFRYIVPFIVQLGLYISPVGFSSNIVPEKWRLIYYINPMVGVIDGFRFAILGGANKLYLSGIAISLVVVLFIFIFGILYFCKMEKSFADII